MKQITVAVSGAAGQIAYSLLPRLVSGEVFGNDTQVNLQLLEIPQAVKAAEGVVLELLDCGFPTLGMVNIYDNAKAAFNGVNWALLVGSKPRGPGMERADLLTENGAIFVEQGKALLGAAADVRTIVVGNPCNTNALIALSNAQDISSDRFFAMTMLDENRAKAQLAGKANVAITDIKNMIIWGNHSPTMVPDFENASISGVETRKKISDSAWLEGDFLTRVQKRGAEIIEYRGKSSAASAASACLDTIQRIITPTAHGDAFSAGMLSTGTQYGIPAGIVFSQALRSDGNSIERVAGITHTSFIQNKMDATIAELLGEREIVQNLL